MCDSYRFLAGRTYELPALRTTPLFGSPAAASARVFRFTMRTYPPLQCSGTPLLLRPALEFVPVPGMFVPPSWLATITATAHSSGNRAACDPATSRHRRQAPA